MGPYNLNTFMRGQQKRARLDCWLHLARTGHDFAVSANKACAWRRCGQWETATGPVALASCVARHLTRMDVAGRLHRF